MVRGSGGQGGGANYDVSQQGTLAYVPSFVTSFVDMPRRLVAVDMQGDAEPLIEDQRNYWRPRISPDGTRVVVEVLQRTGNMTQLWIVELERRTATPLTAEGSNAYAVWSPDGKSVVYRSNRPDSPGIYRQAADGSGAPQLLSRAYAIPGDASRAGIVVFSTVPSQDIGTLRVDDQSTADFLATPAREHMARFSPDGKWLAYASNESGQDEVYVRPFPRAEGAARLVSVGGGSGPTWAPDGSTLYYRGASGELMAVAITVSKGITTARPRPLFRYADLYRMSGTATAYDIHPDGKRFIMVSQPAAPASDQPRHQVNVVLNWFEELKRIVPTK
jgi:Tol biopolymer transport system component